MSKDLVKVVPATSEAVEEFVRQAEAMIDRDPVGFCEANPWALDCPRCGTFTPLDSDFCPGCGLAW